MENATNLSVDPNYLDIEHFAGSLFPKLVNLDKWTNAFIEAREPKETYQHDTRIYNFSFEKRHTNYWRGLSGININLEVYFEKMTVDTATGISTWIGVKKSDMAVPISGLCSCLWKEVDIRCNQVRITNSQNACQTQCILSKLTSHQNYESTIGAIAGIAQDTEDPDNLEFQQENLGFIKRQEKYCSLDAKNPKLVPLSGPLIHSLSALRYPIPSEIQVDITLHRNSNQLIITNCKDDEEEFRIRIHKIELLLPTFILNPKGWVQ